MVLVGYIPWYPHSILSACFGGQGNVPLSYERAAKYDSMMMMMMMLVMKVMIIQHKVTSPWMDARTKTHVIGFYIKLLILLRKTVWIFEYVSLIFGEWGQPLLYIS